MNYIFDIENQASEDDMGLDNLTVQHSKCCHEYNIRSERN